MKKTILISVVLIFFGLAPHAFAEGFVPLAPIPGLTQGVAANTEGLANFFNNLYKYLIGVASVLAVIMIIWGGLRIATNQDNVSVIMDSKGKIINAILGLILVLSPVLVFTIINPSILNLSISLDPLDTASGFPTGTGGWTGTSTPTTDPTSGCTYSGTFLKQARCPSIQAALEWGSASCRESPSSYASGLPFRIECNSENPSGDCVERGVVCELESKAFMFLDVSRSSLLLFFSDFQPLASTSNNSNNGNEAIQFINQCTRDGGLTCLVDRDILATDCHTYYTSIQPSDQVNECRYAKLRCYENTLLNKSSECSSSPSYTPIR